MQNPPSDCPIIGAHGFSIPEGTSALRVLILGDCCDESDAYAGKAFAEYGRAGSLLERAIRRCGYDRQQFVLHNVVPTQPPNNKLEGAPYEHVAVEWGRPTLERVIHDYAPSAILALGGVALRATTGMCGEYRSVSHLQNWVLPSRWPGVAVVPALHPAFIRSGHLPFFSVLMHDLKLSIAVASTADGGASKFFSPVLWRDTIWRQSESSCNLDRPAIPAGYICYPNEGAALDFLHDLEGCPERLVAFDIETPRSASVGETDSDELAETQILSIQFSHSPGTGIFFPWREPYIEVAKAILALKNPKVGANSWRFDAPMLAAHGCRLNGASHDVRWAFGALQPDLKAGLQFIASFYCAGRPGWGPWKHQHGAMPEWYGIKDVDAVQCIMVG
jgi:uracil-DNA glycosylase family 4